MGGCNCIYLNLPPSPYCSYANTCSAIGLGGLNAIKVSFGSDVTASENASVAKSELAQDWTDRAIIGRITHQVCRCQWNHFLGLLTEHLHASPVLYPLHSRLKMMSGYVALQSDLKPILSPIRTVSPEASRLPFQRSALPSTSVGRSVRVLAPPDAHWPLTHKLKRYSHYQQHQAAKWT